MLQTRAVIAAVVTNATRCDVMGVGASVFELSKLYVLNFHYSYIKENIQARSVADRTRAILCGSGHATTAAWIQPAAKAF